MTIFTELSLIIVLAAVIAGLMRVLKQPLIMGHILTGLIVGPLVLGLVHSTETIEVFAEFGVSILLFIVGLHLSPKVAREVGKVALIAGLGQILFTSFFGYLIAKALGFAPISALYIAAAVTFSSTIIVLKILADKKDIGKLYAKISIGLLLVQDIVAALALIFITASASGGSLLTAGAQLLIKGLVLTVILVLISYYILPKLSDFFAKSTEFLFLFALGWGLGLASLFNYIGFSVEIGALIAGVALSVSPYNQEISSKLKPLRDFFIVMFFVFLGAHMDLSSVENIVIPLIILSAFVLFAEPIIIMLLTGFLRYNKKTSFMTGVSMGQISEFSLILVLLGKSVGHIENDVLTLVTFLALVTFASSTYLMMYSEKMYPRIAKYLNFLERKKAIKEHDLLAAHEVVIFGANRVGYDFLNLFKHLGQSLLVIDFDPALVAALNQEGVNAIYGDAEDSEFLEEQNLQDSKMVVSTIPEYEVNSFLLEKIRGNGQTQNDDVIVILISYDINEALKLYDQGATYIILPHFIGGHFAAMLATKHWLHIDRFAKERTKHIEYLTKRKDLGHIHPKE